MPQFEDLLQIWLVVLGIDFLRYFLAAGFVFTMLNVLFRKRLQQRKIQKQTPTRRQMWREFSYSLSTVFIFAGVGIATFFGPLRDTILMYTDIHKFGWSYAAISLVIVLILHDAYFYWTHRLMHYRYLFRYFHRVHHLSRTPSPWAAYAFAPPEALVQALFLPVIVLCLPLHPGVITAFLAIMIVRNALGHAGIEVFSQGFADWRFGWSTTVTHHDLHHRYVNGNYGLYFTWWDRLMGTEHPAYVPTLRQLTTTRPACTNNQTGEKSL